MTFLLLIYNSIIYGNNASYIALSNQIARDIHLSVISNNLANTSTNGYESSSLYFNTVDVKQNNKKSNSFVQAGGAYIDKTQGALSVTNRALDVAIINNNAYFKILTPNGDRYTLKGSFFINTEYILVNDMGFPVASSNNTPIVFPDEYQDIAFASDGSIYVDNDIIDVLGVFHINDVNQLIREGNNMYKSAINDILEENPKIAHGALRKSNVNSINALAEMSHLERSMSHAINNAKSIHELYEASISKIK